MINFLIKKWKNDIFFKNPKNEHFYKDLHNFQVLKFFSPIFFYKIWTKYRYENVQKLDFCSKIDQIMSTSNMPKIKKTPCTWITQNSKRIFFPLQLTNSFHLTFILLLPCVAKILTWPWRKKWDDYVLCFVWSQWKLFRSLLDIGLKPTVCFTH